LIRHRFMLDAGLARTLQFLLQQRAAGGYILVK
jgi:hypothetical protein